MKIDMPGNPVVLSRVHWLFLAFILLVAAPALLVLTLSPEVDAFVARNLVLPRLEKELGFKIGAVQIHG